MKLIREINEDLNYLTEEKDGKKNLYIEGIFLQGGIVNRNGRRYDPGVLEREVTKYINEKVNRNTAFGELGHPNGPQINLDRVSHVITELRRDGNNWIGKARIVDEGLGKIARGIMEAGGRLGVSSRGLGTLKAGKDGIMEVQGDFRLATAADIVSDPSAPDAYVNGILEGVGFVFDETNNKWNKVVEAEQARIREVAERSTRELEEKKLRLFESFVERLAENSLLDALKMDRMRSDHDRFNEMSSSELRDHLKRSNRVADFRGVGKRDMHNQAMRDAHGNKAVDAFYSGGHHKKR